MIHTYKKANAFQKTTSTFTKYSAYRTFNIDGEEWVEYNRPSEGKNKLYFRRKSGTVNNVVACILITNDPNNSRVSWNIFQVREKNGGYECVQIARMPKNTIKRDLARKMKEIECQYPI